MTPLALLSTFLAVGRMWAMIALLILIAAFATLDTICLLTIGARHPRTMPIRA